MSGKAYRRNTGTTPMFSDQPVGEEYYEVRSSGYNWDLILMLFIVFLVAVVGIFSGMGWHEAKKASNFAYNAEDYSKHHKLRDDARHTCYPLYHEAADANPDAAVLILDWLNYNTDADEHRDICLFIASPPPPPTPSPTPAPTPVMIASDEGHQSSLQLSERLCALFEGFPFEEVCGEWRAPLLTQAVCSCAPVPEMQII